MDSYRGDWQVYPGKGYIVAFANPTGSNGYGQDFVDAIACDWGGRVYEDLMRVADGLEALPYVDKSRMGAMGLCCGAGCAVCRLPSLSALPSALSSRRAARLGEGSPG
jgi:dipeptidyl aminopeptidase/acylaminoacyl peptidase